MPPLILNSGETKTLCYTIFFFLNSYLKDIHDNYYKLRYESTVIILDNVRFVFTVSMYVQSQLLIIEVNILHLLGFTVTFTPLKKILH